MTKNYEKLCITKETYDLVVNDCVKEFIRNNPHLEGLKITHEIIIRRMADYYLERIFSLFEREK